MDCILSLSLSFFKGHRLDKQRIIVLFPAGTRALTFLQSNQWVEANWSFDHSPYLVPGVRMAGAIPQLPICLLGMYSKFTFSPWCSLGEFYLILYLTCTVDKTLLHEPWDNFPIFDTSVCFCVTSWTIDFIMPHNLLKHSYLRRWGMEKLDELRIRRDE